MLFSVSLLNCWPYLFDILVMCIVFNLVLADFEIGSEKSSKTGQSQGEFL